MLNSVGPTWYNIQNINKSHGHSGGGGNSVILRQVSNETVHNRDLTYYRQLGESLINSHSQNMEAVCIYE